MTRVPLEPRRYTVEEYFQIDEASETRHEYVDGHVFDMAGGTDTHSQITGPEAIASIPSIGIELPLAELYAGVEFPPETDGPETAE